MIVDANILISAVDETSTHHPVARHWLESALNGTERVGLPWASLLAFQRIITHPRAMASPLSPEHAWGYGTDWLDADLAWVPVPGARHRKIIGELLTHSDARGNLVPDAHLAALALEHGIGVCSFDSDFARFAGVRWIHPGRPTT